jgi:hypothetical protein
MVDRLLRDDAKIYAAAPPLFTIALGTARSTISANQPQVARDHIGEPGDVLGQLTIC